MVAAPKFSPAERARQRALWWRVDQDTRPMPDYGADQSAWTTRARAIIAGMAKARGIVSNFAVNEFVIVPALDQHAAYMARNPERDPLRALYTITAKVIRDRKRATTAAKATAKRTAQTTMPVRAKVDPFASAPKSEKSPAAADNAVRYWFGFGVQDGRLAETRQDRFEERYEVWQEKSALTKIQARVNYCAGYEAKHESTPTGLPAPDMAFNIDQIKTYYEDKEDMAKNVRAEAAKAANDDWQPPSVQVTRAGNPESDSLKDVFGRTTPTVEAANTARASEQQVADDVAAIVPQGAVIREEQPVAAPEPHWIKNTATRAYFWGSASNMMREHGVANADQEQVAHEALGVQHLVGRAGTVDDALAALKAGLTRMFPPTPAAHWATDHGKVRVVLDAIKPLAKRIGLDVDDALLIKESCRALKIETWQEFAGTGKEFVTALSALWAAPQPPPDDDPPVAPIQESEVTAQPPSATDIVSRAVIVDERPASLQKPTSAKALAVVQERRPAPVPSALRVNWEMSPIDLAKFAVESGLYSSGRDAGIRTVPQAMVIMMRGIELGISPFTALEQINIINGKSSISSALFLALIERSGELENMIVDESVPDEVSVTLKRKGRDAIKCSYSRQNALDANLWGKDNWRKQPRVMMYHRALGMAGRRAFSDILLFGGGIYLYEEMNPDAAIDENGEYQPANVA